MRILAIDTALAACAVAVLDTGRDAMLAGQTQPMQRGHAEALMPLIRQVMTQAGLAFSALDRIAVTVGPGSFTGLRVGIAAARGVGLAASKPVVGITTLAAYAAPLLDADETIPVVTAIDARHEHVYLQIFGRGGYTLMGPRVASLRDAAQRAAASGAPRLAGDAARLLAAAWPADEAAPRSIEPYPAPDIAWVARLAAAAQETDPVKPLYLRAPDARPQDTSRIARR
ncbi:MAG: tRNA (adenosine(37)-N6)-threonylcarbamoyltransferase complex dimerization subunit type 1 TsaB [Pseudolabrys sp.]|nr:tRNA (adenosine(37)-N6)-threonylcarbamoyltransferase complex dimerization subunit type 1 TsaB [Pseudolabrys sp.]